MDHLIGLIIVGAILLVKFVVKSAVEGVTGGNNKPEPSRKERQTRPMQTSQSQQSEEERMRRFMEALGLPAGSVTPPAAKPRPPISRPAPSNTVRPTGPVSERELKKREAARRQMQTTSSIGREQQPSQPVPKKRAKVQELAGAAQSEANFTIQQAQSAISQAEAEVENVPILGGIASKPKVEPVRRQAVRDLIKNPESVRSAFVLKEILGPPKALQSGW